VKFGSSSLILAATALTPLLAFTPQAVNAQEGVAEEETGIADIVVTARRTNETLQDTPVAVSVITSDKIAEQGLNSIDDFARQATGISFSQAFGRFTDRPVIRGASNVLANVQFGVETGAAYFVDGIYFQGDLQSFDPLSIERVEIVKGPQSALYGRNTYAGAINYITRDPTKELSVSGRARYAEHNEIEGAVSVSGPIIEDVLGFRAGVRYYDYGGEFRNNITGRKVGQENSKSAYLTLQFKPHPDVNMRTRLNWQRDRDGARAFFLQGAATNNCLPGFRSPGFRNANASPIGLNSTNRNQWFCGVIQPQPNGIFLNTDAATYTLNGNTINAQDGTSFDGIFNSQIAISNTLDWDVGSSGWTISILSGFRKNKNSSGSDSDHSYAFSAFGPGEPLFTISDRDRQVDMSQEFKLSSPAENPFRVMIGGYIFKQKFWSQDYVFADPVARTGQALLPLGGNNSQYATILNRAIFGMVSWDVTEALTVSAELRSATETKTLLDKTTTVFAAGASTDRLDQFGCVATPAICTTRGEGVFKGTDPRITINYNVNDDVLVYANYATGRKPGGFNGTTGILAAAVLGREAPTYEPEKSKGFEFGIKFDALDRRLRGSFAAYRNKLSNVQLSTAIPGAAGSISSIVTTTSNARTQGFELELQATPATGLSLSGGISYVDAKFRSGCDADLFIYQSGGLRPNFNTAAPPAAGLALCDLTGKRLPLGSPWTANGSISYEAEVSGNLKGFGLASFSYESKKNVQTDNFAKVGSAFLVNARIGVKTENFTVALFGRNLTNEDSVPLATRWFDLRYGSACRADVPQVPSAACPSTPARVIAPTTFNGATAVAETGSPRGIFGALRKSRTFGVEATFNF
jgi:iron complex outermembrane recepter protein